MAGVGRIEEEQKSRDEKLDDALVERVADRILDRIAPLLAPPPQRPRDGLVNVQQVALLLGVSVDYVYRHAGELGAIRIGSGPKPRLRFDVARARKALAANETAADTARVGTRRPQSSSRPAAGSILSVRPRQS